MLSEIAKVLIMNITDLIGTTTLQLLLFSKVLVMITTIRSLPLIL